MLLRPPGYSETFIDAEIRALRAAGAVVEVFVAGADGRGAQAGRLLRVLLRHPLRLPALVRSLGLAYGPRGWLAAGYALGLAPAVSAFAPDVVHTHFVNLPAAVALAVGRECGTPVTAIAHAADFLLDRDRAALRRRLVRLDHLFVISAATTRQLAELGVPMDSVPHRTVRAAFDGVLAARPPVPSPPAPPAVTSDPATGGPALRLVTVARLVAKKGVDTAIEAVARLVGDGWPVRYDVYGDGPLRTQLLRLAADRGVDRVVRLHGAVPHRVATAALGRADAAVLACRRAADGDLDGIPVFLMEAAGRGVPVITTAVSGIPELVHSDGGWLVPPDDPSALAAAVRQLAADPAEADRRARALAARLAAEFSPALQARRLCQTWRALARGGCGPESGGPGGTADIPQRTV